MVAEAEFMRDFKQRDAPRGSVAIHRRAGIFGACHHVDRHCGDLGRAGGRCKITEGKCTIQAIRSVRQLLHEIVEVIDLFLGDLRVHRMTRYVV